MSSVASLGRTIKLLWFYRDITLVLSWAAFIASVRSWLCYMEWVGCSLEIYFPARMKVLMQLFSTLDNVLEREVSLPL